MIKYPKPKAIGMLFLLFDLVIFHNLANSSNIDLNLNYNKNISEKKGVDFSYKINHKKADIGGGFRYFKENDSVTSNNAFLTLDYNITLSDKWGFWLFDKLSYDRIQKINLQNNLGSGIKYSFTNSKAFKSDISLGFLYDRTEYEKKKNTNKIRLSDRLRLEKEINEKTKIYFLAFYQPDIADFKDYIITSNLSISYMLSQKISLKFKIEDTYRSKTLTDYYNDLYSNLYFSFNF
ncbi:MAG: DUF481 domain-containing protein [Elusimicrobiales bacterium]|nr:DUF481 domain-containing protein [Elusimicrobiales bacterium]